MKKIVVSAGVVALGVMSTQAAVTGLDSDTPNKKPLPLSISLAVRGFYDDNYNTIYGGNDRRHSYGVQLMPTVGYSLVQEQTYVGLTYTYDMRWFEDRQSHQFDNSHEVSAQLKHNFTEETRLALSDSFNIFQEPLLTESGISQPIRANQNNKRNDGKVMFDWDFMPQLGLNLGYQNTWYNYADQNFAISLDRDTHLIPANLRYKLNGETTIALLGYQYAFTDYSKHVPVATFFSDDRNSRTHYYFLGLEHNFNTELNGSIRAGAQTVSYDLPGTKTYTSPYVDAALTYRYAKGSFAQLGFRNQRTATDLITTGGPTDRPITLDAESRTFYGQATHAISPKLTGTLTAAWQMSDFRGGSLDSASEDMLMTGLVFSYEFMKHWWILNSPSFQLGYNFDWLTSDSPDRAYHRNRVFLGAKASW